MFPNRLRALAQLIGFAVMSLFMVSSAVSIFWYADHALGAPVQAETQADAGTMLQQQQDARVPQILNYAGELRDTEGQLVSGTYNMTFRIYDDRDAEPSQALWSEVRSGILVQNGRFGLVLGEGIPISPTVFNGPDRYFGISVESVDGGSPISEDTSALRKRFAMVPFAAKSGYASALMASDGDPYDAVIVDSDGHVGIGVLDPLNALHIAQPRHLNVIFDRTDTSDHLTAVVGSNGSGLRFSDSNFFFIGSQSYDNRNDIFQGNELLRITADGKVGIGIKKNPQKPLEMASGAYVTEGGVWTNASDRGSKENIVPVEGQVVLDKLAKIPISKWSYKNEDTSIHHIGPMAQDFYAAFGLGQDDKHIGTVDADGVALTAIQALYARSRSLEAENVALRSRIDDLEMRLAALEKALLEPIKEESNAQ